MKDSERLKQYELKVLDKLDQLCKDNGLKYYLAYGSAIGAIRHKGFIPWDDDIDTMMKINDYLKFRNICVNSLDDNYYFQDKCTDKYYYNPWAKLGLENTTWMPKNRISNCKYGICVDIFLLFPIKDNLKNRKYLSKYVRLLNITSSKYYVLNTNQCWYKRLFHRIIPDKINTYMFEYSLKKLSKFCNDFDTLATFDMTIEKLVYFRREEIEGNSLLEFENNMYPVPSNIDKYLTTFYGAYMELPSESERYNHDIDGNSYIYDFDKSYKYYQQNKNKG